MCYNLNFTAETVNKVVAYHTSFRGEKTVDFKQKNGERHRKVSP